MTTLPNAPGVVKTVITGTIGSAPFVNIFHWLMDTTSGLSNAQALQVATNVLTAYGTNVVVALAPEVNTQSCQAIDLTSISGGVGSFAHIYTGGGTGAAVPANSCTLVKHLIARRYRGGHPRTYLPPLQVSSVVNANTWDPGGVSFMQSKFNAFIAGVLSGVVTGNTVDAHVNVSYYSGHALRSSPLIEPISGSIVEGTIATQRRRIGR